MACTTRRADSGFTPTAALLPGFAEGRCAIQDAGAQWASQLLPVSGEDRVLDVGSAPGGKLFASAALHPAAEFVAVELSEHRSQQLMAEAERLGLTDRFTLHIEDAPQA